MNVKSKLAATLRRMADRLAPAPAGDCGSGATYLNYTLNVPAGAPSIRPTITGSGNTVGDQIVWNPRFDTGDGWTPA